VSAVRCPTGCGSRSFRAARHGVIVEDFTIDEYGDIVTEAALAEAGGRLMLTCSECGHSWRSRRDLQLAYFIEAST
jgi:hypothetical protein